MEKGIELERRYPFEVSFDENFDWLDLTIDVELDKPATDEEKKELENILTSWASEGIENGYGDGVMHDWNEEENEWDKGGRRFRFWTDMGSSDKTALEVLFSKLAEHDEIKKVRIGSRYQD